MEKNVQTANWHTAKWGAWGWAETVAKLIGIAAGLAAFEISLSIGPISFGLNIRLAAFIVFVLASAGAIFQLVLRLKQRETISLIFAILNLLGHLGLLFALMHEAFPPALPVIFGGFFIAGQLIKLQFLRATGYTEEGSDSAGMLRFTAVQAGIYLVFAVLAFF